jgi:DNA-directed RNA polymerase
MFDPDCYARLSDEARLYALGLCANVTLIERNPPALDTEAATRAKAEKAPGSVRPEARAALKLWIEPLAAYLAKSRPPRGLETVLRGLSHEQLAFMALRSLLDRIWAWEREEEDWGANPAMLFRLELGRGVRDELEFSHLFIAKPYVKAARNKHAALGKFRRVDWTNAECAQVGDWLWDALAEMSCFDEDDRGLPCIHPDHKAALDQFAEDHLYDHPLYKPRLLEQPPPWTDWWVECPGDIGATFVQTTDPRTIQKIQAAFAEGSIGPHAEAVSRIQSVPLKINAAMLPVVREFADDEYRRDVVIAEALVSQPRFWNRVRCDWRGRLIQLCDFNYTRGDPVRSLFMFADGKPIDGAINWLEIAIANAYGVKGTRAECYKWVADNRELIKAAAADPGLIWGRPIEAKEPFQFAAACIEYVAADMHGPTYETHLPVWLDASSNGLQHLAIMRRSVDLARMVNLEATSTERSIVVHDVREHVAKHMRPALWADDEAARFWRSISVDNLRAILKRPIMTLPYGVTKRGMLDQIKKACEDLKIGAPFEAMVRLRDHAWRAIEEKLPGAMEAREYIQAIARRCLEHGTFVEWTTLTGFPVCNRYTKSKAWRVRLPFLGQSVTIADGYTDEPLARDVINGIVANVTHSMDATHLALSVNRAAEEDITTVATIHDCYGALAPDVKRFAEIRRSQLSWMALHYNTLARLRENLPLGTNDLPLPAFDPDFDRFALGESEYFDR